MTLVILRFMKTAISIPDPLFEAADRLAAALGVSRSELYAKAVQNFVQRRRRRGVTEALNRVFSAESSSLDQFLADIQASGLPDEGW